MGRTMDPTMVNYGMFHGVIHGKIVPHGIDHGAVHGSMVCTMLPLWETRFSPWCIVEHAMIYSIVPDDASVNISSMGQPTT